MRFPNKTRKQRARSVNKRTYKGNLTVFARVRQRRALSIPRSDLEWAPRAFAAGLGPRAGEDLAVTDTERPRQPTPAM
jgi:hypothetical protein